MHINSSHSSEEDKTDSPKVKRIDNNVNSYQ